MAKSSTAPDPEIVRLHTRIFESRLKVSAVLARARVNRSKWYRWCNGDDPRVSEIRAIDLAIDALTPGKELPYGDPSRRESAQDTTPE